MFDKIKIIFMLCIEYDIVVHGAYCNISKQKYTEDAPLPNPFDCGQE